jgi:hypothetical protein
MHTRSDVFFTHLQHWECRQRAQGLLYGGGSNSSGELGLGSVALVFVTVPREIDLPREVTNQSSGKADGERSGGYIQLGGAGLGFTCLWSTSRETVTAGTNIFGQIGLGKRATPQGWRRRDDGQFRMVGANLFSFGSVPALRLVPWMVGCILTLKQVLLLAWIARTRLCATRVVLPMFECTLCTVL